MSQEMLRITDGATSAAYEVAIYRYGNPGKPVVLCVHGLTRNAADFHYIATALSGDYYAWCIDIPGRGNSPRLQNTKLYNNPFYASLIAQWLEAENVAPLNFIGTSMGGIIGMILAATKPKLIKSLLLNDVGTLVPASEIRRLKEYVGVGTQAASYEELAARMIKNLTQFGIQDEAVLNYFVEHSIEPDGAGGYQMRYDPAVRDWLVEMEEKDIDLSALWKAVKCPTLIFRGAKSDLLPEAVAGKMIQQNPKSMLYTVDGAGHAPSLTTPPEIACIKNWLAQINNKTT